MKPNRAGVLPLIALFSVFSWAYAQDRDADAPVISSVLEQRDGSRVSIQFRAIHWDPETLADLQNNADARNYYNRNVLPFLSLLETNVKLRIGKDAMDPGSYYLGFLYNDDGSWTFLVSDDQRDIIKIPLPLRQEENTVPFLSFVFTPGITERDFILTFLYGNLSTAVRVTMTGFPQRPGENTTGEPVPPGTEGASRIWDRPFPPNAGAAAPAALLSPTESSIMQSRDNTVNPKSSPPSLSKSKAKAGSGAFRYLLESRKKKENP
ncbi:MAG: hypothetical protein ACE15F_04650 [bacterium]